MFLQIGVAKCKKAPVPQTLNPLILKQNKIANANDAKLGTLSAVSQAEPRVLPLLSSEFDSMSSWCTGIKHMQLLPRIQHLEIVG
jgi:hypothetical protein